MSFVFCCYPHEHSAFLNVDAGLARRITDVFVFDDYNADEVCRIFMLKAKKAGYVVNAEIESFILSQLQLLHARKDILWENGAISERLLKEIRISMGLRILSAQDKNDDESEDANLPIANLYIVEMDDVTQAFDHMVYNLAQKAGGVS